MAADSAKAPLPGSEPEQPVPDLPIPDDLSGMVDRSLAAAIRSRADAVRQQIDAAARAAGRDPATVHLIAVTKFFPPEVAAAAMVAGLEDLGENRVQELVEKQQILAAHGLAPRWHLIGTLQRNKVRQVIGRTHLIHSGDSLALLAEISHRSQMAGVETAVLLQLNPAQEESKHGFAPGEFPSAAAAALRMPGLRIAGIMAMAPLLADPEETRPFFAASAEQFEVLCRLHGEIRPDAPMPDILSMGMSQDYQQAIACGATHVRIGTALFGPRPQNQ